MIQRLRSAAARLRADVEVLAVASRDDRVPTAARVVIFLTVAYALSPVDLIPDVIPVLGLLDDLLIVPFGLWLALRLIPPGVIEDARERVRSEPAETLRLRQIGFRIVVALWVGIVAVVWFAFR